MVEEGLIDVDEDGTKSYARPCRCCGRVKALFYKFPKDHDEIFDDLDIFRSELEDIICQVCLEKFRKYLDNRKGFNTYDKERFINFLRDEVINLSRDIHAGRAWGPCEALNVGGYQCNYPARGLKNHGRKVCHYHHEALLKYKMGGDEMFYFVDEHDGVYHPIVDLCFLWGESDKKMKDYLLDKAKKLQEKYI